MALLNITEYSDLAETRKGLDVPVGKEPAKRSKNLTYAAEAKSEALDKGTRFVRLIADADVHVVFDPEGNATATGNSMRLEANVAEYFGINGKSGTCKISAYDGST